MQLIVFRDLINGEYQAQTTLNDGEVNPLAFSDISVSVRRLLKK